METPNFTPDVLPGSQPEPKKNNTGLIIVIVVVVLLCCCCFAGIGGWWLYNNADRYMPTGLLLNLL